MQIAREEARLAAMRKRESARAALQLPKSARFQQQSAPASLSASRRNTSQSAVPPERQTADDRATAFMAGDSPVEQSLLSLESGLLSETTSARETPRETPVPTKGSDARRGKSSLSNFAAAAVAARQRRPSNLSKTERREEREQRRNMRRQRLRRDR